MSYIYGVVLRIVSLGGKFYFLIFAANEMDPVLFGKVAIAMAISVIVIGISGLEGYQTLLRKIAFDKTEENYSLRVFYIYFSLIGSVFSFFISFIVFFLYGWSIQFILLCSIVVLIDHLNVELCRLLIVENKANFSIAALAMRTGTWALVVPFYSSINPDFIITAEFVLIVWGGSSAIGLLFYLSIQSKYKFRLIGYIEFIGFYKEVLLNAPKWVAIIVSWRSLESGSRLLTGLLISEAAAGKITILSTIASLSLVAIKSVIEPSYFSKILLPGADGLSALKKYQKIVYIVSPLLGLFSCFFLFVYLRISGKVSLLNEDIIVFLLLNFSYVVMCISQVHHFKLYRAANDKPVLLASLISLFVVLILSSLLGYYFQEIGVVLGTVCAALVLMLIKKKSAMHINLNT